MKEAAIKACEEVYGKEKAQRAIKMNRMPMPDDADDVIEPGAERTTIEWFKNMMLGRERAYSQNPQKFMADHQKALHKHLKKN